MGEKKFGAIADLNSNRQQLEKIKKDLEGKSSSMKTDLRPIAGGSGEKEIKKSVGADINKDVGSLKKVEKSDPRQAAFEKRIQETLPAIFNAEAIKETINANIASEKKAEKARKIISWIKDDLDSVAGDPEWYKLKWRDDELKNALKRQFIKKAAYYFNTEKLTGVKKFYNYLEGLCKIEKKERKEQKEQPLSKENKIYLDDFKNKIEEGVLEKLNEKEKEISSQEPAREYIKLRRVTPLAKKAIYEVREAFQKNKNLREEDIASLLQKGALKHLSPRERNLVMTDFERLAKSKKDQKEEFRQKTKEKEIKETGTGPGGQLAEDKEERKPEFSGKYYTGAGVSEDAREEYNKFKNGKKTKEKERQEKITQKPERTKEDIIIEIKAAAEIGDEEMMEKLQRELEDFDKTGEELFEEAQALEAEKKFREENPPLRKMEEIEKKRAERAQEKIKKEWAKETSEEKIEQPEDQNNLEQLKQEVEQARKDYLEMDYKKKKAYKRLYDFFGSVFKGKKEDDKEVAYYRAIYDNKIFDYKNALLEDARERGASNKELGDLVKFFGIEANLNVADAHTQVKIENQEGSFSGFIKNHSKEIVERYKKLPLFKKIAIGAVFGLAGAGAVYAGGAAVGIAAGAAQMRRIFMGMVTGTSVALGVEALTRKRAERKVNEEADNFVRQLESLSNEEKFLLANKKITELIYDEDRKINEIKNKNLRNLSLGILAGTVIGSGALSELGKTGWHRISEFFGSHPNVPTGVITPGPGPAAPEALVTPETPEVSPVELTVEKGGSLEGSLADHLEKHPDLIEKYNELHGDRHFDAGQIAHRLYQDYAENSPDLLDKSLDAIYPDATVEINPETLEITGVADAKGTIARVIKQVAESHSNWADIKNLSLEDLSSSAREKIMNTAGKYSEFWGAEAKIKSGEKIRNWVARIARLAIEKK